jgi:hypothetical protein
MTRVTITKYECDVCHEVYDTAEAAHRCESRPITQDKGVKVGDTVRITEGYGPGRLAKVTEIHYIHVDEVGYPTSPMITVDFMEGWIPSDCYEVLKGG